MRRSSAATAMVAKPTNRTIRSAFRLPSRYVFACRGEGVFSPLFIERGSMKFRFLLCAGLVLAISPLEAQMATSHASSSAFGTVPVPSAQTLAKPVARVNGTVLTNADLIREEYAIFPYAN